MTPEEFVASFAIVAEAPGGIKKLRDMILGFAVRGKLVPQDPMNEPASALVKKISVARDKLSKSIGSARDSITAVDAAEEPYALPTGWSWMRLGGFGGFLGGGTPSKSNAEFWSGVIPWVSPKDMKRPYIGDAEDHISEAAVQGSTVKLIPTSSLLFVIRGMILAHSFPTALTTREVTINQDMKALVLALPATGEYLLRACQAARARMLAHVEHSSHGTCRLDSEHVRGFPIPLPPLAEQARIVAKVDQLMALCDTLEAALRRAESTAQKLAEAVVAEIVAPADPQ